MAPALLLLLPHAFAECPAGGDGSAEVVLGRMLEADKSGMPMPVGELPAGLEMVPFALDPSIADRTKALHMMSLLQTGSGTDTPPGFGDVRWDPSSQTWIFYVQPDVTFVADDRLIGHFVKAPELHTHAPYERIAPGLAEGYAQLAANCQVDREVMDQIERPDREPSDDNGGGDGPKPPEPEAERRTRWGLEGGYEGALGPAAGSLVASAMEGRIWVDSAPRLLPVHVRWEGRVGHAQGAPYAYAGVEGDLNSTSVRFTPSVRFDLPLGEHLALGFGAGPALAVYNQDVEVGAYGRSVSELCVGAHGGADLTWYPKRGPGLTGGIGPEVYLHRDDWRQPLEFVGAHVGLVLGRAS